MMYSLCRGPQHQGLGIFLSPGVVFRGTHSIARNLPYFYFSELVRDQQDAKLKTLSKDIEKKILSSASENSYSFIKMFFVLPMEKKCIHSF
jgi:hypothetical protein